MAMIDKRTDYQPFGILLARSTRKGDHMQDHTFKVSRSHLVVSPILRGWIDDTSTLPPGRLIDGALVFAVDAEALEVVVKYLEREERAWQEVEIGMLEIPTLIQAGCVARELGLGELVDAVAGKLEGGKWDLDQFVEGLEMVEASALIEVERFARWVFGVVMANAEGLSESWRLKRVVAKGGQVAWGVCRILIKAAGARAERDDEGHEEEEKIGRLPFPEWKTEASLAQEPPLSPRSTRSRTRAVKEALGLSPKPQPPAEPPIAKRGVAGKKKKSMQATVEDASSSE